MIPGRRFRSLVLIGVVLCATACEYNPFLFPWRYPDPGVPQEEYLPRLRNAPPAPPGREWPLPPSRLEQMLRYSDIEIQRAEGTKSGMTGAHKLDVEVGGEAFSVKWKRAPDGDAEGWNDSPRKELAAYEIQSWIFDEEDFIVPTITLRCVPLDELRKVLPQQEPNLDGIDCVLGSLSIWLQHVKMEEEFYDPERFARDPNYAQHVADLNLLLFLIDHQDANRHNFLVSTDEQNRRIFSIDNGISFGPTIFNPQVMNWNRIRVPMLRQVSIDRLRGVTRADVDALATIRQFERRGRALRETDSGDPGDDGLRFGLTERERDDVWERVGEIVRRADSGAIILF